MKHNLTRTFVLAALAGWGMHLAATQAKADGPFADPNLETAVRGVLFDKKDPKTPLTDEDLRKVFVLEARAKGIKSLAGLEKCTNLL